MTKPESLLRACRCLGVAAALLAAGAARAQVAFTFTTPDAGHVAPAGALTVYPAVVANTGAAADTYTAVIVKEMPAAWSASFCQGSICYAPFVEEISFTVAAGSSTNLDVDVTPVVAGEGTVTVTVTSQADPGQAVALAFTTVTPGPQVLLVDAGEQAGAADLYGAALGNVGVSYATWPRESAGALSSLDLANFFQVVWFCGAAEPGLDDGDRAALAYFVQHGGALMLAGPDLAQEACDPASPYQSGQACGWLQVILGAGYGGPGQAFATMSGTAGDPFFFSLSGDLQGDGGATGNGGCDVLVAAGGLACLEYGDGQVAGVRHTYGAGRTLFCAFAWEGLAGDAARRDLMAAFLAWASGGADVPATTAALGLRVVPNPCNPRTMVHFDLDAATAGPVTVDVLDLRGRRVRRLHDGLLAPGPQALLWGGDDDAGRPLASGVYLTRVVAGGRVATGRVALVR